MPSTTPAGSTTPWQSPQPNLSGRGILAGYSPRFWALVAGIGFGTGLVSAAFYQLLDVVQRLSWHYDSGTYLQAVEAAPPARHLAVLFLAGVIAGGAMVALRRRAARHAVEVPEALWLRGAPLPLLASLARGVASIVTVGMGASLGREGAPQLAGAAFAERASGWMGVPPWQRNLLVACGAGAGMAAIYDVPFGGALFALEVLLGTLALPLVLPAMAATAIATLTAWLAVPDHPTYAAPAFHVTASLMVWAALIGPLAGGAAFVWVKAIERVGALRPTGRARLGAPIAIFTALGAVSIAYPQLLGNGLDIVAGTLLGQFSFGLLLALLVLKPLATVACLGSGSPGGLFTPTLAYGVLFGGVAGELWSVVAPGGAAGSYALVGGGAVLAAAMQGPLSAIVLMLELVGNAETMLVPTLVAVVGATAVSRRLRAPSIYSARLVEPRRPVPDLLPGLDGPPGDRT